MYNLHPGFSVFPTPSRVGDRVKIRYHGLLSECGADQVYLRTGYGSDQWENIYV